jgi:hypothetical protein
MSLELFATLSAGLFAGAAIYINLVEHPARLQCGTLIALKEFAPSYKRATVMQASLAVVSFLTAIGAWLMGSNAWWMIGGVIILSVVPFTLIATLPTNKQLLDPGLEMSLDLAGELLNRWGKLHAIRSILSLASFLIFVVSSRRY